jgi:hypothetical protein
MEVLRLRCGQIYAAWTTKEMWSWRAPTYYRYKYCNSCKVQTQI